MDHAIHFRLPTSVCEVTLAILHVPHCWLQQHSHNHKAFAALQVFSFGHHGAFRKAGLSEVLRTGVAPRAMLPNSVLPLHPGSTAHSERISDSAKPHIPCK